MIRFAKTKRNVNKLSMLTSLYFQGVLAIIIFLCGQKQIFITFRYQYYLLIFLKTLYNSFVLCVFSATLFVLFPATTCSWNPSIYSIYVIYVITGISRLCGTGNKNICGIYSTISTMFTLYFENQMETLCASVYIVYYNTLFYK